MASSQYTHYMQRVDKDGFNVIDIESEFEGLYYLKADGMNNIGKAKNVYTEDYADSDRLRYYVPDDNNYANEATKITMSFAIAGTPAVRQRIFDNFTDYVRKGVHRYWDTARNREFDFIVQDQIKVSDEKWHGNTPYIVIDVPLLNLNGRTKNRLTQAKKRNLAVS